MSTTYAKRGQRKRIFSVLMAMTFFAAVLTGCTHKSQVEDQSKSKPDSAASVAAQDTEVSIDDGTQQEPDTTSEVLDTAIIIDEKLDENLFIKAELKMPEATLYEYSTQLKTLTLRKRGKRYNKTEKEPSPVILAVSPIKETICQAIWTPIVPLLGNRGWQMIKSCLLCPKRMLSQESRI